MEAFLENLLLVLSAIKIDVFVTPARPEPPPGTVSSDELFELRVPSRQLHATARQIDGEFVVQKGSVAAKNWHSPGYENSTYARLYAELAEMGTLREEQDHRVFDDDCAFASVSAAASVVNGHPTSGPLAWKVKGQQKTYKQWETERLGHGD